MKHRLPEFTPLQSLPTPHADGKSGSDITQVMDNIDLKHEYGKENDQLSENVKALVNVNQSLNTNVKKGEDVKLDLERLLKALIELVNEVKDADKNLNISISNARNLRVTAVLSEKSKSTLKEYETDVVDHFKGLLCNNRGVWMSDKVFWWCFGIFVSSLLINLLILAYALSN